MLTHFLKPGGALLVIDMIKDGHRHPIHLNMMSASVHHVPHTNGFDESHLRNVFEMAGLAFSFDAETLGQGAYEDDSDLFIAKGIKLVGNI